MYSLFCFLLIWTLLHNHSLSKFEYVQVPVNIKVEDAKPSLTPEEVKLKAQELRLVSETASFPLSDDIP